MDRLTIELPEQFNFSTQLTVRAKDLNYGGHVGNDAVLSLMQEARILFYQTLGFKDEINFGKGIGQIVSDAMIVYRSESFLGDVLNIKVGVINKNKYGFDLIYLIENRTTGKEAARGKTGIVCFDYVKRKIAPMPESLAISLTA